MDEDSDLEDCNLTEKDDEILPKTRAEERPAVDNNGDQDMSAFAMTQESESETLSIVSTEQTLSTQSIMDDRLMEEGRRLRQLIPGTFGSVGTRAFLKPSDVFSGVVPGFPALSRSLCSFTG